MRDAHHAAAPHTAIPFAALRERGGAYLCRVATHASVFTLCVQEGGRGVDRAYAPSRPSGL